MASRERARDRGRRLGFRALGLIGEELRLARTNAGVSRRELGTAAGISRSTEARYETGRFEPATIVGAAELLAVAGLGLVVSTYPLGDRLRDAEQVRMAAQFLRHVGAPLRWRTEVPLPNAGDTRAWDALIRNDRRTGVEFIRYLGDAQAIGRAIALKRRDGGVDYLLVVIADTRRNRRLLREAETFLPDLPRLSTPFVLGELAAGRHPGDGIVLFALPRRSNGAHAVGASDGAPPAEGDIEA